MADVIGRGDYSKALKAAFGLTGRSALLLGTEIVPVALVSDLDSPPYAPKRRFALHGSSGNVAAQYSHVDLNNGTNSQVIRVLRQSYISGASGAQIYAMLQVMASTLTEPIGGMRGWSLNQPINQASGRSSDSIIIATTPVAPLSLDSAAILNIAVNATIRCDIQVALYPGSVARWINNQVNSLLGATMIWDEYDL